MKKGIVVLVAVVLATLLPSRAEAALPLEVVQCGEPIDHSLRIANNIFGCTSDGLVIVADGITLDLNGNRVTAGLASDDVGIRCGACKDVTIRNGTVDGFEFGVDLGTGSRRVSVKNVRALENDFGFRIDGQRNTVRASFAIASSPGDGFRLLGAKHSLSGNAADDNVGDGFHVEGGPHELKSNTSAGNDADGFDIAGTKTVLSRNLARDNTFSGFITNGTDHVLKRNRSDSNSSGFSGGGSGHRFVENRATANGFDGITTSGTGSTFDGNVASGNERLGFSIGGSENHVEGNRGTGNDDSGIFVFGSLNVVRENQAHGNGEHGIEITSGDGHSIIANVANTNGFVNGASDSLGLGIFVNAGVTNLTAKNNSAKENDAPAQCSPAANCN